MLSPALSEQTLQSHGEYLKEQIGAYQGKARKIARDVSWLDRSLFNAIHTCVVSQYTASGHVGQQSPSGCGGKPHVYGKKAQTFPCIPWP